MNRGCNSCNNRMNIGMEKSSCGHEMQRPRCEGERPSCGHERGERERERPSCGREMAERERVRPSRGHERSRCESERPSCGHEMEEHERVSPSCDHERPRREYTRPRTSYEMPRCEAVKPSCGCEQEKEMVENIFIINDCSCQEFMRMYDWYNCAVDKAYREFLEAEKNLKDAMENIKMGLCYNEKAKEIGSYMDDFLDSMNESNACDRQPACGSRRNSSNCGCNRGCNNSCMEDCDPCMQMREELHEMMAKLNCMEKESLEHTQEAMNKLMEAKHLHKCLCELRSKVAKNCYPRC